MTHRAPKVTAASPTPGSSVAAMRRLHPFAFVLAALLVLVAAGCGVEAGDSASSITTTTTGSGPGGGSDATTTAPEQTTTTTAPTKERSATDQAVVDQMAGAYEQLGLSPEEAECLAGGIYDTIGGDSTSLEGGAVMDVINQCDIPMSKIAQLGGGADGTLESGFKKGVVISLKQAGLTEEQATCVADAYVEKFGTDPTAARNANQMRPLLRGCGVTGSATLGN